MKATDVKEFELGEHCFGEILRVNSIDITDIKKEDIVELLNDLFENDINSENLLRECLKIALDYFPTDVIEEDHDSCEQCGNYNHYAKYLVISEDS